MLQWKIIKLTLTITDTNFEDLSLKQGEFIFSFTQLRLWVSGEKLSFLVRLLLTPQLKQSPLAVLKVLWLMRTPTHIM
jgi:hypothetical protein